MAILGTKNRTVSGVALRDSKDATKQTMFFNNEEWNAFVNGVKGGEFSNS
jgi:hypothetical protein